MKLPTREQCLQFYKELETPENIINHVKKVNEVANFLALKLKEKGININLELVDRASLIHDLDKWYTLNHKEVLHGDYTKKILEQKGYPELGFYAKQHIIEGAILPYKTWEEKIIAYADKRVNGDKIISLKERWDYINKRYTAIDSEKRKFAEKLTYEIEKEIFDIIKLDPNKLEEEIKKEKI
ncbi:MAG: hypothetical protein QXE31_04255 [Candidatus Woesearchaeota archaeon]